MTRNTKNFIIDDKEVSEKSPVYFIADIAANHDNSIEKARELIWRAKEAGADAAKFQHFKADSIVSDYGFRHLGNQISHQTSWKKSVYDVYKGAELNIEWTEQLKKTCDEAGISFFTSPYDFSLIDEVDQYVPAYKIGSGDITWLEIIKYVASKGKPYFLASGASTIEDVVRAVDAALAINSRLCLMQCNTNYTGSLENFRYINLNVLNTYRAMFPGLILGLSDHTPGHSTVLGAIALGARVIEKHFTLSKVAEGPDHGFSMNPVEWSDMVQSSKELMNALGDGLKRIEGNEIETAVLQRRAIRATHDIPSGKIISVKDISFLRPCPEGAIPPYESKNIIGKITRKNILQGEHFKFEDFL
jgi:sialic acid synthase SpsE